LDQHGLDEFVHPGHKGLILWNCYYGIIWNFGTENTIQNSI